jgi:hypothetical protein
MGSEGSRRRYLALRALLGLVCGVALGLFIFVTARELVYTGHPADTVDKEDGLVLALWVFLGIPACGLVGMMWPLVIGPLIRVGFQRRTHS